MEQVILVIMFNLYNLFYLDGNDQKVYYQYEVQGGSSHVNSFFNLNTNPQTKFYLGTISNTVMVMTSGFIASYKQFRSNELNTWSNTDFFFIEVIMSICVLITMVLK